MEKGNVLIIGNSGVGKSTLINAVLGTDAAYTSYGVKGTTKELAIYTNSTLPLRLIDTVGFEPGFLKEYQAVSSVNKWLRQSKKNGNENGQINVIWLCVDGTAAKLFVPAVKNFEQVAKKLPNVPIITVITKSISEPDIAKNISMVESAFFKSKLLSQRNREIIPIVAKEYTVSEGICIPVKGITELIEATNAVLPEGIKAVADNISQYNLNRKRFFAHSVVGTATAGAAVVGAVPIPFSDAVVLGPVEVAEIQAIASIYKIDKKAGALLIDSIIESGTVGLAAKTAISGLKAIPGINLGVSVLNSVMAAGIVALIGEATIYAFEQIHLGKRTTSDVAWVKKLVEDKLNDEFTKKIMEAVNKIKPGMKGQDIAKVIMKIFSSAKK